MNRKTVKIAPYQPRFGKQTVSMWRKSKEQAIGQKELHGFEDHLYFLDQMLKKTHVIHLALLGEKVVGMIAFNKVEISQLYVDVDHQGIGIGRKLLDLAKNHSSGKLRLSTFEVNEKAQRFYEKNGFRIIGRGSDNEEKLPDIHYEWDRT